MEREDSKYKPYRTGSLKLVSVDGAEPITLEQAYDQSYILDADATTESLMQAMISASRLYAENRTWRAYIDATYDYALDEFPKDYIELPKPPCIEVVSVTYKTSDGNVVWDASEYVVDLISEPARIAPKNSFPNTINEINAVTVRFRVGYEDVSGVNQTPHDVKIAMRMLIKSFYDNRDTFIIPDSRSVEAVEAPYGTNIILDNNSVRTS